MQRVPKKPTRHGAARRPTAGVLPSESGGGHGALDAGAAAGRRCCRRGRSLVDGRPNRAGVGRMMALRCMGLVVCMHRRARMLVVADAWTILSPSPIKLNPKVVGGRA
jgi:hypothetical protein